MLQSAKTNWTYYHSNERNRQKTHGLRLRSAHKTSMTTLGSNHTSGGFEGSARTSPLFTVSSRGFKRLYSSTSCCSENPVPIFVAVCQYPIGERGCPKRDRQLGSPATAQSPRRSRPTARPHRRSFVYPCRNIPQLHIDPCCLRHR